MSPNDIIRAWKDEEYRSSLSAAERALLPQHPAGLIELTDAELDAAVGANTELLSTVGCCGGLTNLSCLCSVISCEECTIFHFCIPPF